MFTIIRFLVRRLIRLILAAAVVPMAGVAATKLAERLEREGGPSTTTRLLRQGGEVVSYRRR